MRLIFFMIVSFFSVMAGANTYETPLCYSEVPTTCGFNEMTLEMCNLEGSKQNKIFLASKRGYISGGNIFSTQNGSVTCVVKKVKESEPAKYQVTIKE